jgi:hypothetical protein
MSKQRSGEKKMLFTSPRSLRGEVAAIFAAGEGRGTVLA